MRRFIIIFYLLFSLSIMQAQSQRSLHSLLNEISKKHHITISFSPTLTGKVFPKNTDTRGSVNTALSRVLDGTGFSFKVVGGKYYSVFQQKQIPPVPPKTKSTPPVQVKKPLPTPVIKPDTIAIPTAHFDTSYIHPEYKKLEMKTVELKKITPLPHKVKQIELFADPLPHFALKTNLLYDLSPTINLGAEIGLRRRTSIELSANYNNWTFSDSRKLKQILIQPAFRYWNCTRFSGAFLGVHAHYGLFNWGGTTPWGFGSNKMFGLINSDNLTNHGYEGWLAGAGISYGYHWILGGTWGLEAEIGAGYTYLEYKKYTCRKCGYKMGTEHINFFGPTKIAISLIYILK